MTRHTSAQAYRRIEEEGLLSNRRWQVYDILYKHGPLTANEIIRYARRYHPTANQTGFNARLSELKRIGVVVEVGEKPDAISGQKCFLWDVTEGLPLKLPKKEHRTFWIVEGHTMKNRPFLFGTQKSASDFKQRFGGISYRVKGNYEHGERRHDVQDQHT